MQRLLGGWGEGSASAQPLACHRFLCQQTLSMSVCRSDSKTACHGQCMLANSSHPSATARDVAVLVCCSPSVCSVSAVVLPAAPAHIIYVFEQNHLAVFSVVHPLAPSISSSVASSLASSTGSGSSSPTALPTLPARALPLDPAGNTVEAVLGKSQHFFPLSSSHGHCVTWACRICGAHVT